MKVMKKYVLASLIVAGVGMVILGFIGYLALSSARTTPRTMPTSVASNQVTVTIGDTTVAAELVQSEADITRGLSGRASLPDGQGMLFVMPYTAQHKFWMPDMHFAIDIVWLDDTFKVVDISINATPESYPATFMPSKPALYVLEVPSGFAATHKITIGEQAILKR
jgi:uncharacterized membrane protein (UPF0127 family)